MTDTTDFQCDDFDRACSEYLAGQASERLVQRVEFHASHCARCELLLDNATRQAVVFSPTLAPEVRESVMRSIVSVPALSIVRDGKSKNATPPQAQRSRPVARIVLPLLAVAAALAVVVVSARDEPTESSATAVAADSTEEIAPITAPLLDHDVGFVYTAARVASAQAQAEFAALDDAAQELEAALAQTPNDRELRAFLASVRARRDELTRRVREATL
jgi:hypothetical protein